MFTRVYYRYRDASNYQSTGSVLLEGNVTGDHVEALRRALDPMAGDGNGFIPEQLGWMWKHPGREMSGFPSADDHCYCELDLDDPATFEADDNEWQEAAQTVQQWVDQMTAIGPNGWDAGRYGF